MSDIGVYTDKKIPVILYVTPHLSTGGLPQYLWKKIETFNSFSEIYCVEYSYYGGAFVVQRNKIESLLGDRFVAINSDGQKLESLIRDINPDIVHFEELSETFVDEEVLKRIYSEDRSYYIYETCHSSETDPSIKIYLPDKFIMVSKWIYEKFSVLRVPSELLEYPIEDLIPNREECLLELGLDPCKKHVINVGLFTQGKNQGELIEYARSLENFPIEFHFIGNQADNFNWYWNPLMENLPNNCRVWGEREDVNKFYQIADLFVFTSKFELNPLCVKESLSWKNEILLRKMDTYSGIYDNDPRVTYLSDRERENCFMILEILGFVKKINENGNQ